MVIICEYFTECCCIIHSPSHDVNAPLQPSLSVFQNNGYVVTKCQLDATDNFYCRFYCFLNMFRAPLCPSSEAREYKICTKNHLSPPVGILFPHINEDARSKSHQTIDTFPSFLLRRNAFSFL
jgi:hypothetical protein